MIGKIRETLGADAALLEHQCKTVPKENLHLAGTGLHRPRSDGDRSTGPHARQFEPAPRGQGGSRIQGLFRFCRLIRALSTLQAHRSLRTRSTSIPRTSSSSQSKVAATPLPARWACSVPSRGNTRTRFHF